MVKTWQIVLATLGIFVAGLVAGGATALGIVRWAARHPRMVPPGMAFFNPRGGMQQPFGPQLMRGFADKLDITEEQRRQVEPIIGRTAAQLGRERRASQIEAILAIEKMQDEISALLTADQKARFEQLVSEHRERLQRRLRQLQAQQEPK
jgi:Spy/CpxP family protein refolding chaperone